MDMAISKIIKLFLATSLFFLVLDFIWLNLLAKNFYISRMSALVNVVDGGIQFNLYAALAFYLVFMFGLFVLVLPHTNTLKQALLLGAVYGLVTYGTYDLTNHAVMKSWSTMLTVVDMAWGVFICSTTSIFATWIKQFI